MLCLQIELLPINKLRKDSMPTNKNASIRYQALDKCFRDKYHRYYMEDLIDKCEEALFYYNGVGGVSRRQIFEDIKYMESEAGWSADILRKKDGIFLCNN